MKIETSSPIYYFLAGALLPSIAYAFLVRSIRSSEKIQFIDEEEEEEEDDDDDTGSDSDISDPIEKLNKGNPSKWGITNAPYKVSEV